MNVKKYTPVHHLHTAVLFMVFNRLDTTKQVFQAIRPEPHRGLQTRELVNFWTEFFSRVGATPKQWMLIDG